MKTEAWPSAGLYSKAQDPYNQILQSREEMLVSFISQCEQAASDVLHAMPAPYKWTTASGRRSELLNT